MPFLHNMPIKDILMWKDTTFGLLIVVCPYGHPLWRLTHSTQGVLEQGYWSLVNWKLSVVTWCLAWTSAHHQEGHNSQTLCQQHKNILSNSSWRSVVFPKPTQWSGHGDGPRIGLWTLRYQRQSSFGGIYGTLCGTVPYCLRVNVTHLALGP